MKVIGEVLRSGNLGQDGHIFTREAVIGIARKMRWEIEELPNGEVRAIAEVEIDLRVIDPKLLEAGE